MINKNAVADAAFWDGVDTDQGAADHARAVTSATVALAGTWPFLGAAQSSEEFEHRLALMQEQIERETPKEILGEVMAGLRDKFLTLHTARLREASLSRTAARTIVASEGEQSLPQAYVHVHKHGSDDDTYYQVDHVAGPTFLNTIAHVDDREDALAKARQFTAANGLPLYEDGRYVEGRKLASLFANDEEFWDAQTGRWVKAAELRNVLAHGPSYRDGMPGQGNGWTADLLVNESYQGGQWVPSAEQRVVPGARRVQAAGINSNGYEVHPSGVVNGHMIQDGSGNWKPVSAILDNEDGSTTFGLHPSGMMHVPPGKTVRTMSPKQHDQQFMDDHFKIIPVTGSQRTAHQSWRAGGQAIHPAAGIADERGRAQRAANWGDSLIPFQGGFVDADVLRRGHDVDRGYQHGRSGMQPEAESRGNEEYMNGHRRGWDEHQSGQRQATLQPDPDAEWRYHYAPQWPAAPGQGGQPTAPNAGQGVANPVQQTTVGPDGFPIDFAQGEQRSQDAYARQLTPQPWVAPPGGWPAGDRPNAATGMPEGARVGSRDFSQRSAVWSPTDAKDSPCTTCGGPVAFDGPSGQYKHEPIHISNAHTAPHSWRSHGTQHLLPDSSHAVTLPHMAGIRTTATGRECDICKYEEQTPGVEAKYDGKTAYGPWANMCQRHAESHGVDRPGGPLLRPLKEASRRTASNDEGREHSTSDDFHGSDKPYWKCRDCGSNNYSHGDKCDNCGAHGVREVPQFNRGTEWLASRRTGEARIGPGGGDVPTGQNIPTPFLRLHNDHKGRFRVDYVASPASLTTLHAGYDEDAATKAAHSLSKSKGLPVYGMDGKHITGSRRTAQEGIVPTPGPNPNFFGQGTQGLAGPMSFPEDPSADEPKTNNRMDDFYGDVPPQVSSGSSEGPVGGYSHTSSCSWEGRPLDPRSWVHREAKKTGHRLSCPECGGVTVTKRRQGQIITRHEASKFNDGHVTQYVGWAQSEGHDPDNVATLKRYEKRPGIGRAHTNHIADQLYIGGGGEDWRSAMQGEWHPGGEYSSRGATGSRLGFSRAAGPQTWPNGELRATPVGKGLQGYPNEEQNVWGTPKSHVGPDFCPDCERPLSEGHYDNCPQHRNNRQASSYYDRMKPTVWHHADGEKMYDKGYDHGHAGKQPVYTGHEDYLMGHRDGQSDQQVENQMGYGSSKAGSMPTEFSDHTNEHEYQEGHEHGLMGHGLFDHSHQPTDSYEQGHGNGYMVRQHLDPEEKSYWDSQRTAASDFQREIPTVGTIDGLGCPWCKWTGRELDARTQHIRQSHPGEYSGPTSDIMMIQDRRKQARWEGHDVYTTEQFGSGLHQVRCAQCGNVGEPMPHEHAIHAAAEHEVSNPSRVASTDGKIVGVCDHCGERVRYHTERGGHLQHLHNSSPRCSDGKVATAMRMPWGPYEARFKVQGAVLENPSAENPTGKGNDPYKSRTEWEGFQTQRPRQNLEDMNSNTPTSAPDRIKTGPNMNTPTGMTEDQDREGPRERDDQEEEDD